MSDTRSHATCVRPSSRWSAQIGGTDYLMAGRMCAVTTSARRVLRAVAQNWLPRGVPMPPAGRRPRVSDERRCQSHTDGIKHGRVYYQAPRPCKNYALRGFTRCLRHIDGSEYDAWAQRKRAAQATDAREGE